MKRFQNLFYKAKEGHPFCMRNRVAVYQIKMSIPDFTVNYSAEQLQFYFHFFQLCENLHIVWSVDERIVFFYRMLFDVCDSLFLTVFNLLKIDYNI